MRCDRTALKRVGACLAALLTAAPVAAAETIRIVVPFAAGGPADMLARLLSQPLQASLGSSVVVENRGGAGGVLGTEVVAKAAPDGATLLLASMGSQVISATLQPRLAYDPVTSFEPLVLIGSVPALMVINTKLPASSLRELIALAKNGRKLSYGSAGPGTTMNIAGEQLNAEAGIKIAHVPYRGAGPALTDLIGGHVDVVIADPPVLLGLVADTSVRAIALFGTRRSALLPDVATTVELGFKEMRMENWYGVLAPAGLASEQAAKLEAALLAALALADVKQKVEAGGLVGVAGRAGFSAKVASDLAYWAPAVKKLGITAE